MDTVTQLAQDTIDLADALIHNNDWDGAEDGFRHNSANP
jgi:hypothetical protein